MGVKKPQITTASKECVDTTPAGPSEPRQDEGRGVHETPDCCGILKRAREFRLYRSPHGQRAGKTAFFPPEIATSLGRRPSIVLAGVNKKRAGRRKFPIFFEKTGAAAPVASPLGGTFSDGPDDRQTDRRYVLTCLDPELWR